MLKRVLVVVAVLAVAGVVAGFIASGPRIVVRVSDEPPRLLGEQQSYERP